MIGPCYIIVLNLNKLYEKDKKDITYHLKKKRKEKKRKEKKRKEKKRKEKKRKEKKRKGRNNQL